MTWTHVRVDFETHPVRLVLEVLGMILSIAVAVMMMLTTPNPPMLVCYLGWNIASGFLLFGALSRHSVGFSVLYALFLCIDSIGLYRTVS